TVHCAEIMAAVDALRPTSSDEHIFVVVRHADDFMRHNLPNGENQIKSAAHDEPIDLRRPIVIQLSLRLLMNELSWNDANCFHVCTPLVDSEKGSGNIAEHGRQLLWSHCAVCPNRRKNRLQSRAVILTGVAR